MTHQNELTSTSLVGLDETKLVGVPVKLAGDSVMADQIAVLPVEVKKKRGRPPRSTAKAPPVKKQKDDEDVCFICFDGGSLVLCDRRACPKAYHPACIKRDEEFFRSNAKWNCGWHICSVCQKAAHYMCYTCPFSLCKGCTRDSSYLSVRGNKGFCTTCMKVIMLIENKEQTDKETAKVDFDDSRNWEYLFKIYWVSLKDELSLTSKELAEAKNPWKELGSISARKQPSNLHGSMNNFTSPVIDMSSGHLKGNDSLGQHSSEPIKLLNKASLSTGQQCNDNGTSLEGHMDWASKKLSDFVAYMKNGDTSVLSPFDVQVLVLDYIKRNNLHDPCESSYVVCDSRLENLFGKSRVGHIEMPKLLDFHFLMKAQPENNGLVRGRVDDVDAVQVPSDQSNSNLMSIDKKPNTRQKVAQCALQASLNEYAAINVSNIKLIYLRRNLLENLIQVKEKFHEMVIGSLVRIRISGDEHKQDMYRLVQVVGTTKVSVPYKIGNTTSDIMLEILNLDKKEFTSIDAISNQDLSEDDCRRLRQSIKCGLVKRFTVGEIQKKAVQLQVARLNDSLEAEMSRLNHLRDRASKNGLENEFRECVEKIQLLKAPEERQRRLSQVPEVSSDPNMDPDYESEEDIREHGHHVKPSNPEYNREGSEPVSLRKRGEILGDNSSRQCNSSSSPCEGSQNLCVTSYPDKEESAAKALQRLSEGKFACRSNSLEKGGCNRQAVATSTIVSEVSSASLSEGNTLFASNSETKLWHYRDPNGSIQGPFSLIELQKWSTTGYFPLDMRIWANGKQDDSVFLTDALKGHFHKALPGLNDISSQLREVGEVNCKSKTDVLGSDRLGTQSSAWTAPIVSYNKYVAAGTASQNQDSFKDNSFRHKALEVHSQLSSSTFAARDYATHPHDLNSKVKICNSDSDPEISLSRGSTVCNNTGDFLGNHCNSQGFGGQSSEKNLGHSPVNFLPNNLDLNSVFCPTKSTDSPDQSGEIIENKESASSSVHVHDPYMRDQPNFTLKINNDQKGLAVEKKQSVSSNISVQDSAPSWSSTSSIMLGRSQASDITDKWGGYTSAPIKHSVEWDSNLMPVSSSLHDHVGTATPRSCEPTQFTLLNPASNFSSWHTSGSEPIEFSTLAEESVSDLLAEVDAMESQCGMASPTSMMNYGEDLINLNLEIA
ncbi:Zinc finger CCCH domain-containing protein 44 [Heracleum sosnowskyi]|uniref:Zinc finger CCCH domain-containing protein 44 n=1 Tax=Heracleum sosnowskyi TaxID=360622 RepID=A0AAD8H0W0_9APIA|nr:Zinc finger CCCH domain-containing protein 44 [Heracleum sosnowskyi]